jgi:hypothetical protein
MWSITQLPNFSFPELTGTFGADNETKTCITEAGLNLQHLVSIEQNVLQLYFTDFCNKLECLLD